MVKIDREIALRIPPGNHPFLTGLFAPVRREITADELLVIGEIPKDLEGVYLRNGPNPTLEPRGRYHWFDDDGMVHAIAFHNGARLGWLIDPIDKRVYVYRPAQPVEMLDNPATLTGEPTLPGFVLSVRELW
jgi:retinal pigment epithelial membrane protein/putative restriction endonuclease